MDQGSIELLPSLRDTKNSDQLALGIEEIGHLVGSNPYKTDVLTGLEVLAN